MTSQWPTDDDIEMDRKIDLWHDGYFMRRRGEARPTDPDMSAGWDEANREHPVVQQVSRPEGYYHAPIGTFE